APPTAVVCVLGADEVLDPSQRVASLPDGRAGRQIGRDASRRVGVRRGVPARASEQRVVPAVARERVVASQPTQDVVGARSRQRVGPPVPPSGQGSAWGGGWFGSGLFGGAGLAVAAETLAVAVSVAGGAGPTRAATRARV